MHKSSLFGLDPLRELLVYDQDKEKGRKNTTHELKRGLALIEPR